MINPSSFLRRALLADAAFSGVSALVADFLAPACLPRCLACPKRCCVENRAVFDCLCRLRRLARHPGRPC